MKRRLLFNFIAIITLSSASFVSAAAQQDADAPDSTNESAQDQPATKKGAKPDERLDMPGTSIIGNQELPVGLDIVPWRPAAAGEAKEGPTQLLDEPLEPLDPDVFRRKQQIYNDSKH